MLSLTRITCSGFLHGKYPHMEAKLVHNQQFKGSHSLITQPCMLKCFVVRSRSPCLLDGSKFSLEKAASNWLKVTKLPAAVTVWQGCPQLAIFFTPQHYPLYSNDGYMQSANCSQFPIIITGLQGMHVHKFVYGTQWWLLDISPWLFFQLAEQHMSSAAKNSMGLFDCKVNFEHYDLLYLRKLLLDTRWNKTFSTATCHL